MTVMMITVLVTLSLWWMFVVVQDPPDYFTRLFMVTTQTSVYLVLIAAYVHVHSYYILCNLALTMFVSVHINMYMGVET